MTILLRRTELRMPKIKERSGPGAWMLISPTALCIYAVAGMLALQINPSTGIIFMILVVPYLVFAVLMNLIPALMILDAVQGRLPRFMLVPPLVLYLGTGVVFLMQEIDYQFVSMQANARNAAFISNPLAADGKAVVITSVDRRLDPKDRSDSATLSLVRGTAVQLASRFSSPAFHTNLVLGDRTEWTRYAWLGDDPCPKEVRNRNRQYIMGSFSRASGGRSQAANGGCIHVTHDAPEDEMIAVSVEQTEHRSPSGSVFHLQNFHVHDSKGTHIGSATTGIVERWYPVPIFFGGCGLNSSIAAWECEFDMLRYEIVLNIPESSDRPNPSVTVGAMLGLSTNDNSLTRTFDHFDSPPSDDLKTLMAYAWMPVVGVLALAGFIGLRSFRSYRRR